MEMWVYFLCLWVVDDYEEVIDIMLYLCFL